MTLTRTQPESFQFTQATPAATWTITHDLDRYPIIDSFVEYDGYTQKIIPMSVTYVDSNTCEVQFSEPFAGFAVVA